MYSERDPECDMPYPCDWCNDAPGVHEVSGYGLTVMLCRGCYADLMAEEEEDENES